MKISSFEMKNTSDRIKGRLDCAEEKIHKL